MAVLSGATMSTTTFASGLSRCATFHNTRRRNAKRGSCTPWEVHTAGQRRLLSRRFALHQQSLRWREGRVSFTSLAGDQGRVRFFSETFFVDPTWVHEYAWCTIGAKPDVLKCRHQDRIVRCIPMPSSNPDTGVIDVLLLLID
jgi:hypothetical protein